MADLVEREIQQQAVQAAFPAEIGLLLAGEGTGRIGICCRRPDYAARNLLSDLNSAISLLDGSAEQVAR